LERNCDGNIKVIADKVHIGFVARDFEKNVANHVGVSDAVLINDFGDKLEMAVKE
jgi:hypothetical protein